MTLFDPPPAAVPGPTVRVRMVLAYDGTGFHGFAENAEVRTVAGELRNALERVLRHPVVELRVAGRTDRGVHAHGQVVSFDVAADRFDPPAIVRALNKMLGPEVAVRCLQQAPPEFDARRSARSRTYRYRVLNRPVPDPFWARTSWHVPRPLVLASLRLGVDPLLGEHDFASFCRRPPAGAHGERTTRRRVHRAEWRDRGDGLLELEIEASSFCHQMVRSVAGTLVEMGSGRRRAGEMGAILAARDRAAAGQMAPPNGLTLWAVDYGDR